MTNIENHKDINLRKNINDNSKKSRNNYDLIRQDKRHSIAEWFSGKECDTYETIFIRVLNTKEFVYLFHFVDLSMDIPVVFKNLKYLSFGLYVSLILYKSDMESQEIQFEVNKYH